MSKFAYLGAAVVLLFQTACTQTVCENGICLSKGELNVLKEDPFALAAIRMTGVSTDGITELACPHQPETSKLLHLPTCDKARYDSELDEVVRLFSDDLQRYKDGDRSGGFAVPIALSLTTGVADDAVANTAGELALLTKGHPGRIKAAVGPVNAELHWGATAKHYDIDLSDLREKVLSAKRCFFGVGYVDDYSPLPGVTFNQWHSARYIYGGYDWAGYDSEDEKRYSNAHRPRFYDSLVNADTSHNNFTDALDIDFSLAANRFHKFILEVPLVDFRTFDTRNFGVLNLTYHETRTRGRMYSNRDHELFDLGKLREHRFDIARAMEEPFVKASYNHPGYEACSVMPTIHSMLSRSMAGIVMAYRYTPIVLDLPTGPPHIETADLSNGTFFNVENEIIAPEVMPENPLDLFALLPNKGFRKRTAWLGGTVKNMGTESDPRYRIVPHDGLLAMPTPDGKVRGAADLFGDKTILVDGEGAAHQFSNGFEALRKLLGNKNCDSSDVPLGEEAFKQRYFGPWDEMYFAKYDSGIPKVAVWLDKNRDGKADEGELSALADHRIAAVGVCEISHERSEDRFGNGTKLRSGLLAWRQEDLPLTSENAIELTKEVLHRLRLGNILGANELAEFRVAIDYEPKAKNRYLEETNGVNKRSLNGIMFPED